MKRQEFFAPLGSVLYPGDLHFVHAAYDLAKDLFRPHKRDDGRRAFDHSQAVALQLIERGFVDTNHVVTALLHDVFEDTYTHPLVITGMCGGDMRDWLLTLTKVKFERDPVTGAVTHEVKKDLHEYYRAIENSPALVGRVKCSDRLHNLKTIQVFTRDRKIRYLSETIEFVLPLAWAIDQWARDPKQRFYDDLALHVDRIQKEIGEALSASELRNIEVDEFELLSQVTGDCWGV